MTPRRTGKGRGHYAFDRRFREVGRITASSQTSNLAEFKRRDRLLDRLYEAGQLEALRALRDGRVTATELRQAEREGRIRHDAILSDIALGRRLWDRTTEDGEVLEPGAITRTLPRLANKVTSRRRLKVAFSQLHAIALEHLPEETATVAQLARVPWPELLSVWEVSGATKNRLRAALSSFLSAYLGDRWHPFRRKVMGAMPVYPETERVSTLTPSEFWALMRHVPDVGVCCFVTLASSGMRVGEYLQSNRATLEELEPDREGGARKRVAIHFVDGKGGSGVAYASAEVWDYVRQAVPCRIAPAAKRWRGVEYDARYKRLRAWLGAAAVAEEMGPHEVWIHDLRHVYVQLGTDLKSEAKVQAAVRHKTADMTRRYARRADSGEVAEAVGDTLMRARERHRRHS